MKKLSIFAALLFAATQISAQSVPFLNVNSDPHAAAMGGNTLTIGNITLDLDARNAYRNGQIADLTAKEFDVIEFLMRNPNRVYSREALLDTIWAFEYRSDIRTVDVHIRRLREKLEENPAEPNYIMTKWGVGYYFRK